jgi:hypothetical protein
MGPFLVLDTDTSPERIKLDPIASVNSPLPDDTAMTAKEKNQSGLWSILGKWNRLQASFEFILLEINKKTTTGQKYRAAVAQTFLDLQAAVHKTDLQIQLMYARIGMDAIASEEETVTIWEAVCRVKDEVNLLYDEIKEI